VDGNEVTGQRRRVVESRGIDRLADHPDESPAPSQRDDRKDGRPGLQREPRDPAPHAGRPARELHLELAWDVHGHQARLAALEQRAQHRVRAANRHPSAAGLLDPAVLSRDPTAPQAVDRWDTPRPSRQVELGAAGGDCVHQAEKRPDVKIGEDHAGAASRAGSLEALVALDRNPTVRPWTPLQLGPHRVLDQPASRKPRGRLAANRPRQLQGFGAPTRHDEPLQPATQRSQP